MRLIRRGVTILVGLEMVARESSNISRSGIGTVRVAARTDSRFARMSSEIDSQKSSDNGWDNHSSCVGRQYARVEIYSLSRSAKEGSRTLRALNAC